MSIIWEAKQEQAIPWFRLVTGISMELIAVVSDEFIFITPVQFHVSVATGLPPLTEQTNKTELLVKTGPSGICIRTGNLSGGTKIQILSGVSSES